MNQNNCFIYGKLLKLKHKSIFKAKKEEIKIN